MSLLSLIMSFASRRFTSDWLLGDWQVMGFPIGGDYLSITEGVLSRIEAAWPRMRQHNTWPKMLCGLCRGYSSFMFVCLNVCYQLLYHWFLCKRAYFRRRTRESQWKSVCNYLRTVPQDPPNSSSGDWKHGVLISFDWCTVILLQFVIDMSLEGAESELFRAR